MTILIVDDEEIIRKLIRVALKSTVDAVLLEADHAAGALKIAREHYGKIDLLISDVVMPGRMSGTEMAAQLSHARPEMKIVLMSGYAPEALSMEPSWHFIQKPFVAPEIRDRIGDLLTDNWLAARKFQRSATVTRLQQKEA
jgi:DNA-binding NtrC family response regulator